MLKLINLPPVWLVVSMAAAWGLAQLWAPLANLTEWTGRALIASGLMIMLWSGLAFLRARTTIIPHRTPKALVETGPFRLSRNPIYLADLIILAGWCLSLGAPHGLILMVPLYLALQNLFVLPEEARLTQHLGAPYVAYQARVRRWI